MVPENAQSLELFTFNSAQLKAALKPPQKNNFPFPHHKPKRSASIKKQLFSQRCKQPLQINNFKNQPILSIQLPQSTAKKSTEMASYPQSEQFRMHNDDRNERRTSHKKRTLPAVFRVSMSSKKKKTIIRNEEQVRRIGKFSVNELKPKEIKVKQQFLKDSIENIQTISEEVHEKKYRIRQIRLKTQKTEAQANNIDNFGKEIARSMRGRRYKI